MCEENRKKAFECIRVVERAEKPRARGITYARDRGMGLKSLEATLESSSEYLDVLKLASFMPRLQHRSVIQRKIGMCREFDVDVGLGGALFEIALLQGPDVVRAFLQEARDLGVVYVEICRAIAIVPLSHLLDLIGVAREIGLKPIAEVGVAYGITADEEVVVDQTRLIATMRRCLEAGACKVLLESEGITESRHKKDYRWDVVSAIANTFNLDDIMFEADDPEVYTKYIKDYGPEVNLFVDHSRVMQLESARRGGWGMNPIVGRVATYYGATS